MIEDFRQYRQVSCRVRVHRLVGDVLPPKHQMRWLADPGDLTCREGLEIVFKSTTKEPSCVKQSSVEKLVQRGWAIKNN